MAFATPTPTFLPAVAPFSPPRRPPRPHLTTPRLRRPIRTATLSAASTSPSPSGSAPPTAGWQSVGATCQLLQPPTTPKLLLFFVGGLGAGAFPQTLYANFLSQLSSLSSSAILVYPLPTLPSTDHALQSHQLLDAFHDVFPTLPTHLQSLPLIGLSHSLGCKLLLLASAHPHVPNRLPVCANVFVSFSNARFTQALPRLDDPLLQNNVQKGLSLLRDTLSRFDPAQPAVSKAKSGISDVLDNLQQFLSSPNDFDFTPSPDETLAIAGSRYNISHNLFLKFSDDSIDDGQLICRVLKSRLGNRATVLWREIPGTHVTPVSPDFTDGSFASVGNPQWDDFVSNAARNAVDELNGAVSVIVAFLKLELELIQANKHSTPSS